MYRLAITPGEPAGIGPDILIKIAQDESPAQLIAICDPKMLEDRANQLSLPLIISEWQKNQIFETHRPGHLWVLPVSSTAEVIPGRLDSANANYVLETLTQAAQGCINNTFDAMVTAPVQKSVINEANIPFSGHTEFLQEHAKVDKVVMMLSSPNLRVALVTTHLPLKDVASAVTSDNLRTTLKVLHQDLVSKFGVHDPRILVAGLNPHAGEGGHLGREEIETITPVIRELQKEGMQLEGPLPADTLFTEKYLAKADAVLAMYHDQGLPVLKSQGFGESVNVTLGLPFIRTSVDHGTALEIAGKGLANEESLRAAIDMAYSMASANQSK